MLPLKKMVVSTVAAGMMVSAPLMAEASMGDQTLHYGMKNGDVQELQSALKNRGYFHFHTATGYYGTITVDAVKSFQRAKGLEVDGIAGPQTFQALNASGDNVKPGKVLTMESTAYTANCAGCSGVTSQGINLKENPDAKVISVDPSVIPLGSKVYVEGYGMAIAGDTGGAIKGNKIDVFFSDRNQALQWGRKDVTVKVFE
ncbi:3D domain-containing protein [Aneurinibacillus sp. UBA3580]|jgi:3D (Asp-Asp-Asp) domain-containing protein|uniref:3D domain-containing protein n=1 Tax=Aneurinibacillus sp. UBA3580 TaxID=1946041 RepID=UPI00257BFC5A|nr:3D domain-containing protein [Aneurinibacillus sp. UBA3580]